MMASITVKIQGLKELEKKLAEFEKKVTGRVARKAVTAGARLVRDKARQLAPKNSGQLAKNIVIKKVRSKNKSQVNYGIGLLSTKATYSNSKANQRKGRAGQTYWQDGDGYYGYMIEFGYIQRYARIEIDGKWVTLTHRKKDGKSAKTPLANPIHHPAKPFLRPALATQPQAVTFAIIDQLKVEIKKETEK